VVQTLHWHSHEVHTLNFIPQTPYLLSAGEEAVIVQWHLETQAKSFISRLGSPILNLSLSQPNMTYYGVQMADNSIKVIRFDNNKVKLHIKSVQFESDSLENLTIENGELIAPHKNELQFFNIDDRTLQSLNVKPRNFTSKSDDEEPPATHIKGYCMTPDRKHLITFEELLDQNSHKDIRI
jgi:WD40 repeat protein